MNSKKWFINIFDKYNLKINEKEYDIIVSTCIKIQDSKASPPLSIKCINKIKEKIGGEWLVFVRRESDKNYDFYLSRKKLDKSLSFIYSGNLYDICLIRWKNLIIFSFILYILNIFIFKIEKGKVRN